MSKKTKIFMVLGILLAIIASFFIIIVSMESEVVPDIYAFSNSNNRAVAVKMNYEWNSFNGTIKNDESMELSNIEYKNENILLALPGEKITLKNSDKSSRCLKFYQESFKYYDKSNNEVTIPTAEDALYKENKSFEFNAPETEGIYIYNFTLNYYKKGTVTYAIKIVVSSAPTYDIDDIIQYKNTDLTNISKVSELLKKLPYSKYQNGYVLRTISEPYELIINYKELSTAKSFFENSSIALFALVDNLDIITYKVGEEAFVYSREEIETITGRELSEYANNPELWKKEVMFKEKELNHDSFIDLYKAILSDILAEIDTSKTPIIAIDLNSFEVSEFISLNDVEKRELLSYCIMDSNTIYECENETFSNNGTLIYCTNIVKEEEVYNVQIEVKDSNKIKECTYIAKFEDNKWNIEEI